MWTLYVDEVFLRTQMSWFLPDDNRVDAIAHLHKWDGSARSIHVDSASLKTIEPLWRKMSVLSRSTLPPEIVATRTVELFARAAAVVLSTLIAPIPDNEGASAMGVAPINGRLTDPAAIGHVGRAVQLLRLHMAEPWTAEKVARAVSVSRSHLTRLFIRQTGVGPMRFLTEIRLTEFARLIDESDISVTAAAAEVGWRDPRIASAWFARRFGTGPSQYRRTPHPHRDGDDRDATPWFG